MRSVIAELNSMNSKCANFLLNSINQQRDLLKKNRYPSDLGFDAVFKGWRIKNKASTKGKSAKLDQN